MPDLPARKCHDWIEVYLEYTANQESEERYHFWSAMSAISTALGRRVFMERAYYTLFCNQYIVLVAASAICRKTTAVRMAKDMVSHTQIDILKEKLTTQYLIKHLAIAGSKGEAEAMIYAPELNVFLGANAVSSGLIADLTTLYDCPDMFEYRTKTAGVDIVMNPCVNILGATTHDWMSMNLPGDAVEGGFTSRVIFIVSEAPRHRAAWPEYTDKERKLKENLCDDMHIIAQLKGQFVVSDSARSCFETWYNNAKEPEDARLKSYFGRKGDHILKGAMAISAAQSNALVLDAHHVESAIKHLDEAEAKMPQAFRGVAFSKISQSADRVLSDIRKYKHKRIQHSVLLRRVYNYMDARELREVITTLEEANIIKTEHVGTKKYYHIIKDPKVEDKKDE